MSERNIVLVGFMGSGKSLTSNKLAEQLKRKVLSTDEMIEQKEGRSISDIFQQDGEAYFREREKEAVLAVSQDKGVIIDCGGGVVLDSENMDNLRKNGLIIYLSASPECIYDNVKSMGNRPLLEVDDPLGTIKTMLAERKSFYEQADVTVDADRQPIDKIAEQIIKVINDE